LIFTRVAPAAGQELSELSLPPNGMNQKAEISQWIGLVRVTITYHSPNVHGVAGRDRTGHIWGELVKYGMFDDGYEGPLARHTSVWEFEGRSSVIASERQRANHTKGVGASVPRD
jgi:Protein of unknown function (DUF2911)